MPLFGVLFLLAKLIFLLASLTFTKDSRNLAEFLNKLKSLALLQVHNWYCSSSFQKKTQYKKNSNCDKRSRPFWTEGIQKKIPRNVTKIMPFSSTNAGQVKPVLCFEIAPKKHQQNGSLSAGFLKASVVSLIRLGSSCFRFQPVGNKFKPF